MRKTDYIGEFYRFFKYHPWWLRIIDWTKTHSFPGLNRIPLYNLLVFIEKETREDAIVTRANSMAFSLFMSVFPSIIVLFTLLPYTPLYTIQVDTRNGRPQTFEMVLKKTITEAMPGEAGTMVIEAIDDIVEIPRSGLLSFGFILAMWFASNGMLSMMRGLEKNYKTTFKRRNIFQKRMIAFQLTFLIGFVLIASVLFVILGNTFLELLFSYFKTGLIYQFVLFAFKWVVVLSLFYTTFSTIYRYGSSTRRRIAFFNPGAMLATVLSILTSWGFSYYVNNFNSYNKVYGSIGTLIVTMIWIQLNCMILLIGFELNAGIAVLKDQRKG